MTGFKLSLAAVLAVGVLSACSFKKVDSKKGDEANQASFEVGSVSTVQVVSVPRAAASGLINEKAFHLKTCVIDKPTLLPRSGQTFRLMGAGQARSITADALGCVFWSETVRFNTIAPENFIELNRALSGREGEVALNLAVNPWRDGANALVDTRFYQKEKLGRIVPESEAQDALLGQKNYSPAQSLKNSSNVSVSLTSGAIEQGVAPTELILQNAEFQLKALWPTRDGGVTAVPLQAGQFQVKFFIVERLRSDRSLATFSESEWREVSVTDEGRLPIADTKFTLTSGSGDLSTFELWYRVQPKSLDLGLQAAAGSVLLPDGLKGKLGALRELDNRSSFPPAAGDDFIRAGGGRARREQLGFQISQPKIDHHNVRTVAGQSKDWIRVMKIPVEFCLVDPLKSFAPLVNFPVKIWVGLASQFPDEKTPEAERLKKEEALEASVSPIDANSIPVTDNKGCLTAEFLHRFHTTADSKSELIRIDVEGRQLFKGVKRTDFLELVVLDSTKPIVYRRVGLNPHKVDLQISKKPKELTAKDFSFSFQKSTYELEKSYRLTAHRHYRVMINPKIIRSEDNIAEVPVEQSVVGLRGLVLDGSEAVSGQSIKERALAAFESTAIVDKNGSAQFEVILPVDFDEQYLLDRKTVLWFELRAVGPAEPPTAYVGTVPFPTGVNDGRESTEHVDTVARTKTSWETEIKEVVKGARRLQLPSAATDFSYQIILPSPLSPFEELKAKMAGRGLTLKELKWAAISDPLTPSVYCPAFADHEACRKNPNQYVRLSRFTLSEEVLAASQKNPGVNPRSEPFLISATILNEIQYVKGDAETDRTAWKSGIDVSSKAGYGMFESGGYVRGYTNWEREGGLLHEVRLSQSERNRFSLSNSIELQEESVEFSVKAKVRDCVLAHPLLSASQAPEAFLVCKDSETRPIADSWHYFTEFIRNTQSALRSPFNLPNLFHVVHGAKGSADFKKKMKNEVLEHTFVHLKASGFELDNLEKKLSGLPRRQARDKNASGSTSGILGATSLSELKWSEEEFGRVVGKCIKRLSTRDEIKFDKGVFCYCTHEPLAQTLTFGQFLAATGDKEKKVMEPFLSPCRTLAEKRSTTQAKGGQP